MTFPPMRDAQPPRDPDRQPSSLADACGWLFAIYLAVLVMLAGDILGSLVR